MTKKRKYFVDIEYNNIEVEATSEDNAIREAERLVHNQGVVPMSEYNVCCGYCGEDMGNCCCEGEKDE